MARDFGAARMEVVREAPNFTEFRRLADGATIIVHANGTRALTHPLDEYLHRGRITNDMWTAGDYLGRLHLSAFGSAGYNRINLDGFHGVTNYANNWRMSQSQADNLSTLIRLQARFRQDEWNMLVGVCWNGQWAIDMARACGVSRRQGFHLLHAALVLLSEYLRTGRMTRAPGAADGGDVAGLKMSDQ